MLWCSCWLLVVWYRMFWLFPIRSPQRCLPYWSHVYISHKLPWLFVYTIMWYQLYRCDVVSVLLFGIGLQYCCPCRVSWVIASGQRYLWRYRWKSGKKRWWPYRERTIHLSRSTGWEIRRSTGNSDWSDVDWMVFVVSSLKGRYVQQILHPQRRLAH